MARISMDTPEEMASSGRRVSGQKIIDFFLARDTATEIIDFRGSLNVSGGHSSLPFFVQNT